LPISENAYFEFAPPAAFAGFFYLHCAIAPPARHWGAIGDSAIAAEILNG
jgi:hypothetical protein